MVERVIWQIDEQEIDRMSDENLSIRARLKSELQELIKEDKFTQLSADDVWNIYETCQIYLLYDLGSFFFMYGITKFGKLFNAKLIWWSNFKYKFHAN